MTEVVEVVKTEKRELKEEAQSNLTLPHPSQMLLKVVRLFDRLIWKVTKVFRLYVSQFQWQKRVFRSS